MLSGPVPTFANFPLVKGFKHHRRVRPDIEEAPCPFCDFEIVDVEEVMPSDPDDPPGTWAM
jgi:hypothetical protein